MFQTKKIYNNYMNENNNIDNNIILNKKNVSYTKKIKIELIQFVYMIIKKRILLYL